MLRGGDRYCVWMGRETWMDRELNGWIGEGGRCAWWAQRGGWGEGVVVEYEWVRNIKA